MLQIRALVPRIVITYQNSIPILEKLLYAKKKIKIPSTAKIKVGQVPG
jgi:hypothetical protein